MTIDHLIEAAGIDEPPAPYLMAHCDGGYTTNLPVEDLIGGNGMVATHYDGEPLAPEHGGPARLLVPTSTSGNRQKWCRQAAFHGAGRAPGGILGSRSATTSTATPGASSGMTATEVAPPALAGAGARRLVWRPIQAGRRRTYQAGLEVMRAIDDQEFRDEVMARAAASRRPPDGSSSLEERALLLRGLMSELCLTAVPFGPQVKLEETVQHWLAGSRIEDDEERGAVAVGEALALALDVALFTASASGTTAIDRLARQHRPAGADERAALAALQRATFHILRVETSDPQVGHDLLDLATGSRFRLLDPSFPTGCDGLAVAARVATVEGDAVVTVGPVTPLDEAALDVARARMRPHGRGLTNPNRCAEAVDRQSSVRRSRDRRPQPPAGGPVPRLPFSLEDGPLHALAFAWSEAPAHSEPPAADLRSIRSWSPSRI